ncbi:Sulfotransferase family protein [Reichenbachiella agariperforans]|uniref:Sulfotransferase family protein n=1 Tax=Reichenbachiella agariperforans TaxID=156994 RepID=A0A1M6N7P0_REIAG|nr:sulfotransferase [Reichenbachiella agariperforans]SHJ91682.1 Sulfotransferase family protein [Reichenbachiella agariperforans]
MLIKHQVKDYFHIFKHTAMGMDIKTWIRVLAQYRFAINWYLLPKALFITLIAILNTPFQLIEYLFFDRKIKATVVKRPIFILGHHRSGTTYLHNLMSTDPQLAFCTTNDALVPHLMLTTGKITEKIVDLFMPATRPQDNVKAGAKLPTEEEFGMANMSTTSFTHAFYFPKYIQEIFDRTVTFEGDYNDNGNQWKNNLHYLIQKLTYKNQGKQLVLKSPSNTARVKEIRELYPDALFVHIHRNPYEVFQSNTALYNKILPILSFHTTTTEAIEAFIIRSYTLLHRKYLADQSDIPDSQIIEVAYEDFVRDPMEQLQSIYQQLRLENFDQARTVIKREVKQSNNYQKNQHLSLSPSQIKAINTQWQFFFEAYGYEMI